MLTVLQSLYSSKIEKGFLSLATNLLLELTSQSPDFKRSMFEYPLSECTFQVSDSLLQEMYFLLLRNECYCILRLHISFSLGLSDWFKLALQEHSDYSNVCGNPEHSGAGGHSFSKWCYERKTQKHSDLIRVFSDPNCRYLPKKDWLRPVTPQGARICFPSFFGSCQNKVHFGQEPSYLLRNSHACPPLQHVQHV